MCDEFGVDIIESDLGQSNTVGEYAWTTTDKSIKESYLMSNEAKQECDRFHELADR